MRVSLSLLFVVCYLANPTLGQATKLQVWKPVSESPVGSPIVHAPLDRERINALGGFVLAEYPTFGLVEVPSVGLDAFVRGAAAHRLSVRVRDDFDRILINGFDFPSQDAGPQLPSSLELEDYSGSVGLYLVQFIGPNRIEWESRLLAAGTRIHYFPENTHLVRIQPGTVHSVRALPFVQHVSVYQPAYKISPDLLTLQGPSLLFLQLDAGQNLHSILSQLDEFTVGDPPSRNEHTGPLMTVRVLLDSNQIREFARRPEVIWVEMALEPTWSDERQALVVAGRHNTTQPIEPGTYHEWLEAVGFCTSTSSPPGCYDYYTKVAVFDSGIDKNSCAEHGGLCNQPGDIKEPHLDLGAREVRFYCGSPSHCYSATYEKYTFSDYVFHGTAVASVIAGDPLTGTGQRDNDDFFLGSGIAPKAEIFTMKLGNSSWFKDYTADDFGEMIAAVRIDGARFTNNSWNYQSTVYSTVSQRFDQLVRDAYGPFNNYLYPMTIVFSAGNSGSEVHTPATAKNVITVGGSESFRPPGEFDCSPADDMRNIAAYSSRGVAFDPGRFKPDLVAPSTSISVAHSTARTSAPDRYTAFCGTSAAAPVVSGAAVLADAWYYHRNGAIPSPAMVKAMLVAHASDLHGGIDQATGAPIPHSPSLNQGWGRVGLDGLFQTAVPVTYYDEDHTLGGVRRFVAGEGSWSTPLMVGDQNEDVLLVLAFTDKYAGQGASKLMVNDLDLYVHDGWTRYVGNRFSTDGYSIRTVNELWPDSANTVEVIRVPAGEINGNDFTVEVVPHVNDQAVPGLDGSSANQDFALYVYNGT